MSTKPFRPYDPDQMLLMPPAVQDWVPEGHLARFVGDLVNTLDLSAIEQTYTEDRGQPPYHPEMMVKILLYAYCTGTYSSRRMAAKLTDSVAFRYLAAGNEPDFRTISDFRKRHARALAGLFEQVLRLCQKTGLVKLGRVAIDGTKVKANASKHKAMSYSRMQEAEARLRGEVKHMLAQAEATDRQEDQRYGKDRRGDELPADLARRESRLEKIREAKAALEAEARDKARAEGRDPDTAQPEAKDQKNFTDSESRILKTNDGFIQGYNVQAAVDEPFQIIVAQHVTPASNDVNEMKPAIESIKGTLEKKPAVVLADAGYWSECNAAYLESQGIEGYLATDRQKHGQTPSPAPRGRPPQGLSPRQRMARRLRTVKGRKHYSRRKAIVEPVFGQIKHARGFRQFLRRGLENIRHEWALVCTAHDVIKMFQVLKAERAWA
jgi:transposase